MCFQSLETGRKSMKKFIVIPLCFLALGSLSACSKTTSNEPQKISSSEIQKTKESVSSSSSIQASTEKLPLINDKVNEFNQLIQGHFVKMHLFKEIAESQSKHNAYQYKVMIDTDAEINQKYSELKERSGEFNKTQSEIVEDDYQKYQLKYNELMSIYANQPQTP